MSAAADTFKLPVKMGTNTYKITVTSDNKLETKDYNVTITGVAPAAASNFASDSWETIVYTVRNGDPSVYAPVAGPASAQPTKELDLGTFGKHNVRVANVDACAAGVQTEAACGFVIEFVDSIANHGFLSASSNVVSYPDSEMKRFLTNEVYPAIPEEVRKYIIPTTVLTGRTNNDCTSNCGEGRDANGNYLTSEYLYLEDIQEVGLDCSWCTARNKSQVLKIYQVTTQGITRAKSTAIGSRSLLRGVETSGAIGCIDTAGALQWCNNYSNYAVAPAFRIG